MRSMPFSEGSNSDTFGIMLSDVLNVLRKLVKGRGFTQAELAKRLKVSVPTVKRWLRGDGLDLRGLDRILSVTGIAFFELAAAAGMSGTETFQYTEQQEAVLAKDFDALTVFDHLLHGVSVKEIAKTCSLSRAAISRKLRELESIGLIERHPRDRIKVLVRGEPIWRKDGALDRAFKQSAIQGFLSAADRTPGAKIMGTYWLTPEDARKAQTMLDDLREFLRRAEHRAKLSPERVQLHGCLSVFGPFDWRVLSTGRRI